MLNIPIEFFSSPNWIGKFARKSRKPEVSKKLDKGGDGQNAKLVGGREGRHAGVNLIKHLQL